MTSFPFGILRSVGEEHVPAAAKDTVRSFLAGRLGSRVETYHELKSRPDTDVWEFGSQRRYQFTEPTYSNGTPDEIARLVGEHVVDRPFVLEVPEVLLVGQQGMKRTQDGTFITYNFDRPKTEKSNLSLAYDVVDALSMGVWPFKSVDLEEIERVDLAVPMLSRWATNYAHWAEEFLTQIAGIQHYEKKTGKRPTLLIPSDPPDFIYESLELFGYTDRDYRELRSERLLVERMVLPSVRLFWSGTSEDYVRDPAAVRWLRNEVFSRMDDAGTEYADLPSKLLISREEDADTRRITNWDEVKRALAEDGFRTVVLSEQDYVTQQRLFRAADVVVGTHGAGFSNLIYGDSLSVIELFATHFVPPYYEISQAMGHQYGVLRCESRGDDLFVDVPELLEAIDRTSAA